MNLHSIAPGAERAPQLAGEYVDWLNVERPITLGDLRGRFVVLHFWTYSSINCLHALPALARVDRHLAGQPVAFIGVHTPKYGDQKDPAMVREAVRRHGIEHPVIVDSERKLWDAYAVSAWPTLVVIDPDGLVVGQAPGEPDAQDLENLLLSLLAERRARGAPMSAKPLPLRRESRPAGLLAYPGKALAFGDRLFVADTGHHQIAELKLGSDHTGQPVRIFGTGEPGLIDGIREHSQFRSPHGLAFDPSAEVLWVADTGNHAVRMIDLGSGSVRTIAGTGELGRSMPRGPLEALMIALRSPWGLAWDEGRARLYVSLAGTHQIWALNVANGHLELVAGNGREEKLDGTAHDAALAQPSGLALSADGRLFVADSESNAVREVDLESVYLSTVAGGDLFDFGDEDGVGDMARFAHPVDVAVGGRYVYVTDTYNHRIKEIEAASGRVRSLFGNGHALRQRAAREEGLPFLPAETGATRSLFFEPQGVSASNDVLYVADTNNHRVLAIELDTGAVSLAVG
jgi:sugar lactone lactonase YvrE